MKVKVGLRGAMAEPNAPPLREPTLGELRTAFLTQADYNIRQTTNARATMADIDEARMDPGPRPPMPKKIKKLQDLELEMGNMLDEARELIHSCRTPFANGMSTDDVLRFWHRRRGTGGAPPERVAPRPSRRNAPRRPSRAGGRRTSRWWGSCRRRRSRRSCARARSASTAGTRPSRTDDAR